MPNEIDNISKHEKLASRLAIILSRLFTGERLNIKALMDEFSVSEKTIKRDLKERLVSLPWQEAGPIYYQLDPKQRILPSTEDIQRFARFTGIKDLLPKIDQEFYQEKLLENIHVKGFYYEDSSQYLSIFVEVKKAIDEKRELLFSYQKANENNKKDYQIQPYSLLNKNGIWYLIGLDQGKQKTFCLSQISLPRLLNNTFIPKPEILENIRQSDSISFGNQLNEVVIKVSKKVSPYFLRRKLLPNQEKVHKLENGDLLLFCKNINELEIVPIVRYWIPHLVIISPAELQEKMEYELRDYLNERVR
ncbi:transcriptional regulator [Mergibacter septicus]|uniref:Transcriptional regulator n=1 Tax=Mergibacter septicus TaxID=221402 RepID=A0A8D4LMF4_9PAST|nr:WYL domain-containing protein [Mergibacter septicus]AWX15727.1 transcriptional regulator [Mergibacter septicus]QDJ14980.1 transcriptional regulator [Mergibacter septicus]UTU47595.1 WYL domain-containing protein [Mergibacter septicus]WMR95222.1 WYL domain-containing protein [Mergibacter septicus]